MGKWKYSLDQIAYQIPKDLLERLKPRWDSAMQIEKDIYEHTLGQLLPSITNVEVKESMNKNEDKMALRLNTCLVLLKYIDNVFKNAIGMWKKDDDSDDEEEGTNLETIQFDNEEIKKDKEEEATKEVKEDDDDAKDEEYLKKEEERLGEHHQVTQAIHYSIYEKIKEEGQ